MQDQGVFYLNQHYQDLFHIEDKNVCLNTHSDIFYSRNYSKEYFLFVL